MDVSDFEAEILRFCYAGQSHAVTARRAALLVSRDYPAALLPSIDNKRYFPIFPCVVGLIGY
jgi:hypothetical protein